MIGLPFLLNPCPKHKDAYIIRVTVSGVYARYYNALL